MAEEEEVDYMSSEFLEQCVGKEDVRPGLLFSHSSKRRAEMEKKKCVKDAAHQQKIKSFKKVQEERLEEGLNTALSQNNKGFSMLQKMGYKPGTSLGKESQGRLEPVAVEVKSDRMGLGWQQVITDHRRKLQERKKQKQQKQMEMDPEKFRERLCNQRQEKFLQRDLMKSQRVCHQLDSKQKLSEPVEPWFWPPYILKSTEEEEEQAEEEEEEEECEFEPQEQLNILTAYLRSTYFYCIWCGTVHDDERDLKQNCPGPTRADHDD